MLTGGLLFRAISCRTPFDQPFSIRHRRGRTCLWAVH